MRRDVAMLLATAVLVLALPASPATAQTFLPPVGDVFGGDDEKPKAQKCGHGVTFICAGDKIVGAAGDVVGGAAGDVVGGAAGDVVGGAAGAAGDAVMGGIVDWASSGAAWLVVKIGDEIERSTRPAIGSSWFGRQYAAVRQLAVMLSLMFLLLAIAQAVVRQDARLLAYSVLVALPLAMLLTFAAVILVEVALAVTDWMTAQALTSFGSDAKSAFRQIGETLQPTALSGNALPGLVMFLAAALMAVLALVVWIELVLREASIYVAVTFLPISFVAMIWRPTASWARTLSEWLGAILLAKFTIAVAFAIAGSALAHASNDGGGLSTLLAGCAVLLVAAMTPWVLLRMIPGSMSAVHGMHRGVARQAVGSVAGASTATIVARQAITRSFAARPVAAAAAARPPASRPPDPPPPPQGPALHPPARRRPAKTG